MKAQQQLLDAQDDLQRLHRGLVDAGATPADETAVPAAAPIPLSQLDTSDTRRLLALLQEAQEVAERVDTARGRALPAFVPLGPGESAGTDLAESISELALRLRIEVEGPQRARGRE